jgi:hypothetical protein
MKSIINLATHVYLDGMMAQMLHDEKENKIVMKMFMFRAKFNTNSINLMQYIYIYFSTYLGQ